MEVKNDSEGVMQDTHWASGFYGYFPTYALGNIYSGQLTAALEKDMQNWRSQISQGNLEDIKRWLFKKSLQSGRPARSSRPNAENNGKGIGL